MANGIYVGVDGVARKVKQHYIGVDSVARSVKTGYSGVDGVARQFFSGGTPISELDVGTSVYTNVDGVSTEFLIVHQGLPSSIYDSSCNGTWLLRNSLPATVHVAWDNDYNSYGNSDMHTYLNSTFLGTLDSGVQSVIKQVKIPYCKLTGDKTITVPTGTNGLSTKIFLLSCNEVGFSGYTRMPADGACLAYFANATDSTRVWEPITGSFGLYWWLRSQVLESSTSVFAVISTGFYRGYDCTDTLNLRPAFILPSETLVDSNFNIIT